ncbi:MerR family transcriptional regulator [Thiolinea disciformis]|uniref:MerR family transcriptional regulator n=1 Tax=Thiolinea disciformis TaxID=125614 RepID=UPI00035E671A|nr:MerR family transcriptional regulator [Thiolinea disciformis]
MAHQKANEEALFPIGTVSEETGVNSVTLRAWERRYGLIIPHRTPKGHRLYTQADIQRIHQILQLIDQGVAVGRVRGILDNRPLVDSVCKKNGECACVVPLKDGNWNAYFEFCKRCIYKLDVRSLDRAMSEIMAHYPLELVAKELFLPLCLELHGQCSMLDSTCAEYAFWYEFLRARLATTWLDCSAQANGRRVILMGSSNEPVVHLQMLLFACLLNQQGYQASLLGADCRPQHLPLVLERSTIDAVIFCTPTQDVLTRMDALARLTATHLLVHYLDIPDLHMIPKNDLPSSVKSLPHSMKMAIALLDEMVGQPRPNDNTLH